MPSACKRRSESTAGRPPGCRDSSRRNLRSDTR
jgi:hypothetical protein